MPRRLPLLMIAMVAIAGPPTSVLSSPAHGEAANLLDNGNLESSTRDAGRPDYWPMPDGVTWESEGGNHFLRLAARPGEMLTVYRVVPVAAASKAFAFSFRVRVNDLKRGDANWHDGRIVLDFKNAAGEKLKPGPSHPSFHGTSDGWKKQTIEFLVPQGAVELEVMPAMFSVQSGSMDLDDFSLTPIDPEPLIARQQAAAAKRGEEIAARAAKVKPQVPIPPADRLPPMLHVDGNQIKTEDGRAVWLQGVAIPSLEWSAAGEHILESVGVAIRDWKASVIRLPVTESFWNGTGPYQNDGGAAYRQLVDDVVNLASADGVYTVIDLHRFRVPQEIHAAFWREVATRYRNHPGVLFELFNEPHDVSWQVWRDGGFVTDEKKTDTDALSENSDRLRGFTSVGMQGLVDAVRTTGAKNVVIAGGLDWGYDLSGVLEGFALDDRGGHGIVYSSHVYPWKSDWQQRFVAVAEKYPIFIGECGAPRDRMPFIPPERFEAPADWVPDFLGLVEKHRYHWTAWSFHPKASPVLLKDWTYEPSPHWGVPAQKALQGQAFEMKRMR